MPYPWFVSSQTKTNLDRLFCEATDLGFRNKQSLTNKCQEELAHRINI